MGSEKIPSECALNYLWDRYDYNFKKITIYGNRNYIVELISTIAALLFVSAVWFESDTYRYCAILLLIPAAYHYFRVAPREEGRPVIGPIALMCFAFGAYVALRFAYSVFYHPEKGMGTAEGIYLFPLGYSTVGYALIIYIRKPFAIVSVFVLTSCVFVMSSLDFESLHTMGRATNLLHNNPIHAAVANGIILLCIIPYIDHVFRRGSLSLPARWFLLAIAALTFVAAFANVLTLDSKGVWLALAVALPVQLALVQVVWRSRIVLISVIAAGVVAVALTFVAWNRIVETGGSTFHATASVIERIASGDGLLDSMDRAINDPENPYTLRARLALWANALNIWSDYPVFGPGVAWLYYWQDRPYQEPAFDLIHNGYLEIAVRYGVVGLAFYMVLYGWTIRQAWRASRSGVIAPSAFVAYLPVLVFFAITLFSNSNIRLALGESLMWIAAAFGFWCDFAIQRANRPSPSDSPFYQLD